MWDAGWDTIFADNEWGKYPDTEIAWPWIATAVGVVLTLLTLSTFTFANSGYNINIFVVHILMYILVQFRLSEKFQSKIGIYKKKKKR